MKKTPVTRKTGSESIKSTQKKLSKIMESEDGEKLFKKGTTEYGGDEYAYGKGVYVYHHELGDLVGGPHDGTGSGLSMSFIFLSDNADGEVVLDCSGCEMEDIIDMGEEFAHAIKDMKTPIEIMQYLCDLKGFDNANAEIKESRPKMTKKGKACGGKGGKSKLMEWGTWHTIEEDGECQQGAKGEIKNFINARRRKGEKWSDPIEGPCPSSED